MNYHASRALSSLLLQISRSTLQLSLSQSYISFQISLTERLYVLDNYKNVDDSTCINIPLASFLSGFALLLPVSSLLFLPLRVLDHFRSPGPPYKSLTLLFVVLPISRIWVTSSHSYLWCYSGAAFYITFCGLSLSNFYSNSHRFPDLVPERLDSRIGGIRQLERYPQCKL